MKKHKDALSNTTLKRVLSSKYSPERVSNAPYIPGAVYNRKGDLVKMPDKKRTIPLFEDLVSMFKTAER
jgi:hypothetical protein